MRLARQKDDPPAALRYYTLMKLKIKYNAPVTLNFALLSVLVLASDQLLGTKIIPVLCTAAPKGYFDFGDVVSYIRLFSHIIGHSGWSHLLGNFSLILLLGPILEEKYGSLRILFMILFTALITGILNTLLFSTGLLGASGIVFMMIILISFANIKNGEIPLTFLLVFLLFFAKELIFIFKEDQISQFAHIAGGIMGSLFGFRQPREKQE